MTVVIEAWLEEVLRCSHDCSDGGVARSGTYFDADFTVEMDACHEEVLLFCHDRPDVGVVLRSTITVVGVTGAIAVSLLCTVRFRRRQT